MKINASSFDTASTVSSLRKLLGDPRVVDFAGLLHVDLSNETQRDSVLTSAAMHLSASNAQSVDPPTPPTTPADSRPMVFTRLYIERALKAYQDEQ